MSSLLLVNEIQNLAGTPTLNSSGGTLQVVNTNTIGSTDEISTTSSTFVSTGLSVSIVPSSKTSKLLVQWSGTVKSTNSTSNEDGIALRVYRDDKPICISKTGYESDCLVYNNANSLEEYYAQATIEHLVDSESLAKTTFTLYFANFWGGTSYISNYWGTSSFTVKEISA
jgi:hypothetical protein